MSLSRRRFAAGLAAVPLQARLGAAGHGVGTPAAEAPIETPGWKPEFFDPHQLETMAAIADVIIPKTDTSGAREALVHQHLDSILAASEVAEQSAFLEGLWWLDGYCLKVLQTPFKLLNPAEQTRVLTELLENSDEQLQPGKHFVQLAKTWTARIYYSTQAGQVELNKDHQVPQVYWRDCSGN